MLPRRWQTKLGTPPRFRQAEARLLFVGPAPARRKSGSILYGFLRGFAEPCSARSVSPSKTKEGVHNAQAYFIDRNRLTAGVRRILRRYASSVFAARLVRPGTDQARRQGSGRLAKAGGRTPGGPPRRT